MTHEIDEAGLRAALEARGLRLRPEDAAATLATARFLLRAAELVRDAVGTGVPIETPGGELPPGEDAGYPAEGDLAALGAAVRPIEDAVSEYVEWLRRHPAAPR